MKRDEGLGSETGLEIDRYNAPNASWKQEGPSPFVQPLASRHHPEIESRLNGDARQWRAIDTHQLYLWTWIRATMDPMKRIIIVRFLSLPGSLSLSVYIPLRSPENTISEQKGPDRDRGRCYRSSLVSTAGFVLDTRRVFWSWCTNDWSKSWRHELSR